jgi:extradiol dioxygenase family protein
LFRIHIDILAAWRFTIGFKRFQIERCRPELDSGPVGLKITLPYPPIAGQARNDIDLTSMNHPRFHLAFHVTDLNTARDFYVNALGCTEGRSTDTWVDFDCFGHQLSLHVGEPFKTTLTGMVDGVKVPMPHFGLCLPFADWQTMAKRLDAAKVNYVLPPQIRYAEQPGEQGILFILDPFGNPIEIKGFKDFAGVFAV